MINPEFIHERIAKTLKAKEHHLAMANMAEGALEVLETIAAMLPEPTAKEPASGFEPTDPTESQTP